MPRIKVSSGLSMAYLNVFINLDLPSLQIPNYMRYSEAVVGIDSVLSMKKKINTI